MTFKRSVGYYLSLSLFRIFYLSSALTMPLPSLRTLPLSLDFIGVQIHAQRIMKVYDALSARAQRAIENSLHTPSEIPPACQFSFADDDDLLPSDRTELCE